MIKLEYPNGASTQSVAILPAKGQSIQPALLSALVAGLKSNPLLQPVTTTGMFQLAGTLSAAAGSTTTTTQPTTTTTTQPTTSSTVAGASTPTPVRSLAGRVQPGVPGAAQIAAAGTAVSGLAGMVPGDTALLARLDQQVLVAQSDQITAAERRALLRSASRTVTRLQNQVKFVGSTSVTLTARNVHLPLTIQSPPKVTVHVVLTLASTKLLFKAFKPPNGTCTHTGQTTEVCQLVLTGTQTTLQVPVEARTTGVFTLGLTLTTPNDTGIDKATDTVRSTAVSAVGWILIFGAGLFLGIWWIRDIRSGRRARQLVPRPEEPDDEPEPAATGPTDPTVGMAVHRSGSGGVSPSRRSAGHKDGAADRRNPEEIPT
jgi:hypothetical protein